MLKTEESRIAIVILLTFIVLLVTGIYPQYVLWMTAAIIVLLVVLAIYAALSKKRYGEPQDERTAKCSMTASRNGFIVAMILTALLAVAVKLGSPIGIDGMVQIVWGLSMMTYFLSYIYYKRVA
ncbi:MAG: hypothetical protein WBZ29_10355 [Methanocella sp.]